MRPLFLHKANPSTRRWVMLVATLALVEVVALAAWVLRPVPTSIEQALANPQQRCETLGHQALAQAGEWPTTQDGRDARTLVQARCTLDAHAYG